MKGCWDSLWQVANMREKVGPVLRIGDTAPPLELPTAAGEQVRLEDGRGRAVLVSFLSHAA